MAEVAERFRSKIREAYDAAHHNYGAMLSTPEKAGDIENIIQIGLPFDESSYGIKMSVPCLGPAEDGSQIVILNKGLSERVLSDDTNVTYDPYGDKKLIPKEQKGITRVGLHNFFVKQVGFSAHSLCYGCKVNCFEIPKGVKNPPALITPDVPLPMGEIDPKNNGNTNSGKNVIKIYDRNRPAPKANNGPRFNTEDRQGGGVLFGNDDWSNTGESNGTSPNDKTPVNGSNGVRSILNPKTVNGNNNGRTVYTGNNGNAPAVTSNEFGNVRIDQPPATKYPELPKGLEATELIFGILKVVGTKYPVWFVQDLLGMVNRNSSPQSHRERWEERVNEGLPQPLVGLVGLGGLGISNLIDLAKIAGGLFHTEKSKVQGTPIITMVDNFGDENTPYGQLVEQVANGEIAIINPLTGEQEVMATNLPETGTLATPRKESLVMALVHGVLLRQMDKAIYNPDGAMLTFLERIIKESSDHVSNIMDQRRRVRPSRRFITQLLTDSTNCIEVVEVDGMVIYDGVRKVGKKKLIQPKESFRVTADLGSMAASELDTIRKDLPFDVELLALMMNAKRTVEQTVIDHLNEGVVNQDKDTYGIFFKWEKIKREMGIDITDSNGVRKFIEQSKKYKVNEDILTMLGTLDFILTTAGEEFKSNLNKTFNRDSRYQEYIGTEGSAASEAYINFINAMLDSDEYEELSSTEIFGLMFSCTDALSTAIKCPLNKAYECYIDMFVSMDESIKELITGKERDIARAVILTGLTEAFKDGPVDMGLRDLLFMVAMGVDPEAFDLFLNTEKACKGCGIDPRYCPSATGMIKVTEKQVVEVEVSEP